MNEIVATPNPAGRIALGFLPFTPVQFTGPDAWIAYVRLGIYGFAAYGLWNKTRKISYVLLGAAAISATTSAMAQVWNKNKEDI